MNQNRGRDGRMSWQRKQLVEILRKTGYSEEADEACQTLPESVNFDQLAKFCLDHDISRDELINRMGGSS